MAKKSKAAKAEQKAPAEPLLKEETKFAIVALCCFAGGLFLLMAGFHKAGLAGNLTYSLLERTFGIGFYLFAFIFFLLGASFLKEVRPHFVRSRVLGALFFFVSSLALTSILLKDINPEAGGFIGTMIAAPLVKLFDFFASLIILTTTLVISVLIMFDTHLTLEMRLFGWNFGRKKDELETEAEEIEPKIITPLEEPEEQEPPRRPQPMPEPAVASTRKEEEREAGFLAGIVNFNRGAGAGNFVPPPLSLLEKDSGKPGVGDIKANANIIKRTLANFGIQVEMDEISIGPSVTRYSLKPAEGVKLSRILGLQNDLALALAAHPIRIEAPIPGKALVGIEIPNTVKSTVGLASLLGAKDYTDSPHPLLVALGKGVSGMAHYSNLAKAPHMLVAGATGSGKSVTIHTIVASLLYRNAPEQLRFIMIDPKRVELTLYNKIPHLLTPVITDAKKAIAALRWAAKEMDRRYNILETETVRDIQSYHKNIVEPALAKAKKGSDEEADTIERMPYIVIIIDELADIMTTYPRELEAAIVRLAQMSRAVGIHLMLSTQRPSVEVITGLIKANVPSRIALQVASQIDSRTIIDMAGAEKLLGAGDMLLLTGEMSKPIRLQSAFISETEVKKVVDHIAKQYGDILPSDLGLDAPDQGGGNTLFSSDVGGDEDEDDLYED
ncbi:MAG TPA: DNA translocase FtsK 4TM domain-containing protein, partial [Candidatus Paceibacterota bacterium]|nr:DNA translocase FtsK 4TM domain-containing protein [Candidatus Paceibacterota bacterium]